MSQTDITDIIIGVAVIGLLVGAPQESRPVREGPAARISVVLGIIGWR